MSDSMRACFYYVCIYLILNISLLITQFSYEVTYMYMYDVES